MSGESERLRNRQTEQRIRFGPSWLVAKTPDKAADVKTKPQAIGWFVGQVMKATGGKANPQAVNEITRQAQGCLVQERYHNAAGYTGTSINWFDPADRLWRQLWIDNAGQAKGICKDKTLERHLIGRDVHFMEIVAADDKVSEITDLLRQPHH